VVAGDFAAAGAVLTPESSASAPEIMKALPRPSTKAEVDAVDPEGDGFVALIRYSGDSGSVVVASTWAEVDGAPKIVALEVR
jgi:hypothetical protein